MHRDFTGVGHGNNIESVIYKGEGDYPWVNNRKKKNCFEIVELGLPYSRLWEPRSFYYKSLYIIEINDIRGGISLDQFRNILEELNISLRVDSNDPRKIVLFDGYGHRWALITDSNGRGVDGWWICPECKKEHPGK